MSPTTAARSWRATASSWFIPAWACALLVLALGAAEIAARIVPLRALLPAPSLASPSRRFELQLDGLERYARSEGAVDCIALGNSTALTGIDPRALDSGYQGRRGESLRCFNFGVAGMTASAAGAVAPILTTLYRPKLLLYLVSARDVGTSVDGPLLANIPWVRYRNGAFSIDGWLTEHSAAFRYYLLYRQWLNPSLWPAAASPSAATPAGFLALDRSLPLSAALWAHTQRAYQRVLDHPPSPAEIAGLDQLLAIADDETQVILVEAPAHQRLRRWAHASAFYREAMDQVERATRRRQVAFWRAAGEAIIPADGWTDFVHLNARGAAHFGRWLGARLAEAERSGGDAKPATAPTPRR